MTVTKRSYCSVVVHYPGKANWVKANPLSFLRLEVFDDFYFLSGFAGLPPGYDCTAGKCFAL